MKILVDMNLPPAWAKVLADEGWEAFHWSEVGDPRASDRAIMEWARINGYAVFTHDLDFGALLSAVRATGPSVVLVRSQDVLPSHLGPIVIRTLRQHEGPIEAGAIVVIDEARARVRVLPLDR